MAAFATDDRPMNISEIGTGDRTDQRLERYEPHRRWNTTQIFDTIEIGGYFSTLVPSHTLFSVGSLATISAMRAGRLVKI